MPADTLLSDTLAKRRTVALRTEAFRLSHYELHPEMTVDVYGGHLLATVYPGNEKNPENAARYWCGRIANELQPVLGIEAKSAVWKLRPDNLSHLQGDTGEAAAAAKPLSGTPPAGPFVIHENGVPLRVSFDAGFSTGLFLDMRDGRKVTAAQIRRRTDAGSPPRVLNLFSYTGAFSTVAARSGASEVVEVDTGKTWLDWSKENAALSGVDGVIVQKRQDAIEFLEGALKRGERFDVVIVDPPSYSSSKSDRFTVRDGYLKMVPPIQRLLAPDGLLLAASNHSGWTWAQFRQMLGPFRLVERIPAPEDFPGADYLKVGLFGHMTVK